MELFVFRHSEWSRLYNCSAPDLQVDLVPLERRRLFSVEAWVTGGLCLLYYVLYAPCLLSIWRHRRDNACYKLLFYIGVMDLSILWLLGFVHAWLSLEGAVFCSRPVIIYWAGMGVTGFWMAESTADLILAINRCLELLSPNWADKLFAGWRIWIWLSFCSIYALYWIIFIKPVVFSALHFAWFFDPFVGYREDSSGIFKIPLHSFHDSMVAISSPVTYLLFAIVLKLKSGTGQNITRLQKMTFLQVFIISLINTLTGSLYVIMQLTEPRQWLITLGQFAWLHIHGFPPVIYLCLNKTMREDCRKLFFKIFQPNRVSQVHGVTVIRREGSAM